MTKKNGNIHTTINTPRASVLWQNKNEKNLFWMADGCAKQVDLFPYMIVSCNIETTWIYCMMETTWF